MTTTSTHPPGELSRGLAALEHASLYLDEAADALCLAAREVALAASEAPIRTLSGPTHGSTSLGALAALTVRLDREVRSFQETARRLRGEESR